ncbi:hypothetical protein, partial [Klebsiella quasipneumoniae]
EWRADGSLEALIARHLDKAG